LGVRYLVVGDDFRFGQGRKGNFALLQEAGKEHGFPVVPMLTFNIDDARVGSTRVRAALAAGDLAGAEKLLGRPYRMSGRVAHGDKLGRTLGIPTANLYLHRKATPVRGVYVVEVFGLDQEPLRGAANVGTRPTVNGTRCLLEVHLLDFDQEIYGRYLHVNFLHKLRDEKRYDTLDELKHYIHLDIAHTREFFRTHRPSAANGVAKARDA
jgi:riboflavin kinase/FMN adenylyltransferase